MKPSSNEREPQGQEQVSSLWIYSLILPTWAHLWSNVLCCLFFFRWVFRSLVGEGKIFATSIKRSLGLTLGTYFHINMIFSSANQKCSEIFISDEFYTFVTVEDWQKFQNCRSGWEVEKTSWEKMFLNYFFLKMPETGRHKEVSLLLTFSYMLI